MTDPIQNQIALTDIIHSLREEQRQLIEQYETDKKKARIKIAIGSVGLIAGVAMTYAGAKMLKDKLEDN